MLNSFDVSVPFLFTVYKHCCKQISVVILKPNLKVTSPSRYLYENFQSYDSSDHIYTRIYDFSYVRKFRE